MFSRLPSTVSICIAALLLAPVAAGCTLAVGEPEVCEADLGCVSGFGFGSVCQSDGYCSAPPEVPARCARTFPDGLLDRPAEFADHIIIGSLFSYEAHNDTLQAAELAVR